VPRRKQDLTEEYQDRTRSRPPRADAWKGSSIIEIAGVAATVDEHARAAKMPTRLLIERLNAGWSPELIGVLLRAYDPGRPRGNLSVEA
jgi:hypothetical protein